MKRIHKYLTLGLSAMLMLSASALPASAAADCTNPAACLQALQNGNCQQLLDQLKIGGCDVSDLLKNCNTCSPSDLLNVCNDCTPSELINTLQQLCQNGSCLPGLTLPTTPTVPETSQPETSTPAAPETSQPETSTPAAPETSKPETSTPADTSNESFHSAYESEVVRLVNIERAKAGLPALTADSGAAGVAQLRAREIVTSFSHTRPDGRSCFTAASDKGISYRTAGENIAYGYATPEQVVTGWMNSEGHRKNILSSGFTKIGVGCYESGGVRYWTQFFMG